MDTKKVEENTIIQGDSLQVLKTFPDEFVNCVITSPPYWGLRDYGVEGQLGLEKTPEEYVVKMVAIFHEIKRVLKKEGTVWLNLGDSYNGGGRGGINDTNVTDKQHTNLGTMTMPKLTVAPGLKPKDLVGIPWRVAFALQADGWYLRQDIIWAKPNPMPESVTDRCTKSHEYVFLLAKSQKYYFDNEAIKEPIAESSMNDKRRGKHIYQGKWAHADLQTIGTEKSVAYIDEGGRNKRDVWTITVKGFADAHFATFPEALIIPMVKAGCPEHGLVLDPFMGSGTTALVAKKHLRNYLGIELNPKYVVMAEKRLVQGIMNFI